jgi:dihydrofolate reductase
VRRDVDRPANLRADGENLAVQERRVGGQARCHAKYVFSSTLAAADWNNSTIVRGDVVAEVTKLKQQEGGSLLILGDGLLGETLLTHHLLDVLDISIHPLIAGGGKLFFRESENAKLRLVTTKSFSKGLVKLTYEPQY